MQFILLLHCTKNAVKLQLSYSADFKHEILIHTRMKCKNLQHYNMEYRDQQWPISDQPSILFADMSLT